MEIRILNEKKIDLGFVKLKSFVRDWCNFLINGENDNETIKNIPFRENDYWCPTIDVDEGKIVNWPLGIKLDVLAKTCDENKIYFCDKNMNKITWFDEEEKDTIDCYEGYVPDFLDTIGDGCGDYIQLNINEDGKIKNWNKEEILNIFEKEVY